MGIWKNLDNNWQDQHNHCIVHEKLVIMMIWNNYHDDDWMLHACNCVANKRMDEKTKRRDLIDV